MHTNCLAIILVASLFIESRAAILPCSVATRSGAIARLSQADCSFLPQIQKRQRNDERTRREGAESTRTGRARDAERPLRGGSIPRETGRAHDREDNSSRDPPERERTDGRTRVHADLTSRPEQQRTDSRHQRGPVNQRPTGRTRQPPYDPERTRGDSGPRRHSAGEPEGERPRENDPAVGRSHSHGVHAGVDHDRPTRADARAEAESRGSPPRPADTSRHPTPRPTDSRSQQHSSERAKGTSTGAKERSAISTLAHAGISTTEMPDFSDPFEGEGGSKKSKNVPTHAKQSPAGSKNPPGDSAKQDRGTKKSDKQSEKTHEEDKKTDDNEKKSTRGSKENSSTVKASKKQSGDTRRPADTKKTENPTKKSGETKKPAKDTNTSVKKTEKPAEETGKQSKESNKQPTKATGPEAAGKSTPWKNMPLTELKSKYPGHYKSMWSAAKATIATSLRWVPTNPSQYRNIPKGDDPEHPPVRVIPMVGMMPIDEE